FTDWEYVIVDNCSTDASLAIAEGYARNDSRIRICKNERFLSVIDNFNHSLAQIDPASTYCKFALADDCLFPECLSRMVRLADENPSVGIVSSYCMRGSQQMPQTVGYSNVVSGREVCRATLINGIYVFGSPNTLLIRMQTIKDRSPYFSNPSIHADTMACFEVLRSWDFGFVPEVLSFTRLHEDSVTSRIADRFNSHVLLVLEWAVRYGPIYLTQEEYQRLLRTSINKYYEFLAGSPLLSGREFWSYHKRELERIGLPLSYFRLAVGC